MTADTAMCFGCGARFARAALEEVGDTVFCHDCLAGMLRRSAQRVETAHAAGVGGTQRGSRASEPVGGIGAPCFVCGEPLEGCAVVELRGVAICATCSRGLVGEDAPAVAIDRGDGDPAPAAPLQRTRAHVPRTPVIEMPGAGTAWCTGCGRSMPGPGSYRLVDGRPRCAACVAAQACDGCCRVVAGALRETHGFALCAACLDSDAELALSIARARHRHRLTRAGHQLLHGDGEGEA